MVTSCRFDQKIRVVPLFFDFEIGLATVELSDATFEVGLCDEKGLFIQIDVGL